MQTQSMKEQYQMLYSKLNKLCYQLINCTWVGV